MTTLLNYNAHEALAEISHNIYSDANSKYQKKYKDQTGEESIPAIAWLDSKLNPVLASSGVCIGLYNESARDEIADNICEIDGMECLVPVAEEDAHLFAGKTLDYDEGWLLR